MELRKKLPQFSPGTLSSTKSGNYAKWYHLNNHKKTYISKHSRHLAEELALKKYLSLQLGGFTIYPDFTIRHPVTDKILYWEHFGLMDDPSYSQKALSKLNLYNSHGILPSAQLITTFETLDTALSPDTIERTINFYFR